MKKIILIAICICACAFSLRAQTTVTGATVTKYEATAVETQPKMFVTPLVAELSIIPSASTVFKIKGKITLPEAPDTKNVEVLERYAAEARRSVAANIEELKAQALFQFAESTDADVIVAPTYSVETDKSDGREVYVTVKVKGFPARYTNFRNLRPDDSTLVYMNNILSSGKQVKVLESSEASLETVAKKQ